MNLSRRARENFAVVGRLWGNRNLSAFIIFSVLQLFAFPHASLPPAALAAGGAVGTSFANAASDPLPLIHGHALIPIATPNRYQTRWVTITAYSSTPDQTDATPFITANGTYVHDGVLAANFLPFGTRILIPSLFGSKEFTVHDRMHPRFRHTVDIWMPSRAEAKQFGVRYAQVVVIEN